MNNYGWGEIIKKNNLKIIEELSLPTHWTLLRQSRDGGRRIEHDLGAVQPERARALGEVAVVADVDADVGVLRLETG